MPHHPSSKPLSARLNERFTDLADRVSQVIGEWPITAVALLCLVLWIAIGPAFHWSDTWQLIANTPTTWIELFIGFLCAAATNRAEKHLHKMLGRITTLEDRNSKMEREHGQQLAALREENTLLHTINEEQLAILRALHAHTTPAAPKQRRPGREPNAARGATGRYVKAAHEREKTA